METVKKWAIIGLIVYVVVTMPTVAVAIINGFIHLLGALGHSAQQIGHQIAPTHSP